MTVETQIHIPFIMTCNVTGLQKSFTNREYIASKLSTFNGNLKKMLETYVCEDAKRLLKEGKTVRQVNIELGGNKKASDVDLSKLILDRRMSSQHYRDSALKRRRPTTAAPRTTRVSRKTAVTA